MGVRSQSDTTKSHQNVFLRGYDRMLRLCLRFRFLVLLVFVITTALSVWLLMVLPKGFFPQEDIGQLPGRHRGAPGHLLRRHGQACSSQVD
jgi:multidrug efflux pump subunit AcrB